MSLAATLEELELPCDTMVKLICEEQEEVFHYTDDYHDEAVSATGIISLVAELLSQYGSDVYHYGSSMLEDMRGAGLLEEYERDDTFEEYLEEVLYENYWELEFIEFSTHKYDHKRGKCVMEVAFEVPLERVLTSSTALQGWKASVPTPHGVLMIG